MKALLLNLLICFIGSLLALGCFVGIVLLFDSDDDETSAPLDKKVIAYFDAHDISYEVLADDLYSFSYNDHKYFWEYYPKDECFLRIISQWENDITDRTKLLELANQLEYERKCIKIILKDDNSMSFSIEYYVSRDCDIDSILTRSLELMENSIQKTLEKKEEL